MTLWGTISKVGGSILGSLFNKGVNVATNAASGAISTKQQYEYQSKLMEKQQAYQTAMSNTAHQREVQDLQKAGLNPILSAMNGSGASTPATGLGQVNAPDYGTAEALQVANQEEQTKADTMLKGAQTGLTIEQRYTEQDKQDNYQMDTMLKNVQKIRQEIENSFLPEQYKKTLEKISTESILNVNMASAKQSEILLNEKTAELRKAQIEREKAETQYTKERDRGFNIKSPNYWERKAKKWFNWDI